MLLPFTDRIKHFSRYITKEREALKKRAGIIKRSGQAMVPTVHTNVLVGQAFWKECSRKCLTASAAQVSIIWKRENDHGPTKSVSFVFGLIVSRHSQTKLFGELKINDAFSKSDFSPLLNFELNKANHSIK